MLRDGDHDECLSNQTPIVMIPRSYHIILNFWGKAALCLGGNNNSLRQKEF